MFRSNALSLKRDLDDLDLIGRKILSFDIVGRLRFLNHQMILDCYNNCVAPNRDSRRRPGSSLFESEIPLDLVITRGVSAQGPYIMKLDDGRTLTIEFPDINHARARASRSEYFGKNEFVNASAIMHPVIGEQISAVRVGEVESRCLERPHIGKRRRHPIKNIRIDCEEHALYFSFVDCTVLRNAEKLDPLPMTMGELKDAISYYSDLFNVSNGRAV